MTQPGVLLERLPAWMLPEETLVIGLGNPDRADDGVGIAVVSEIRRLAPERIDSELTKSVEASVLDVTESKKIRGVLFIDAAEFGGRPGEIRLFSGEETGKIHPALSTHQVPISMLIEILRRCGKDAVFAGVQYGSLAFLGPMTDGVKEAKQILVDFLTAFLGHGNPGATPRGR